jgi:hypothetical protein
LQRLRDRDYWTCPLLILRTIVRKETGGRIKLSRLLLKPNQLVFEELLRAQENMFDRGVDHCASKDADVEKIAI